MERADEPCFRRHHGAEPSAMVPTCDGGCCIAQPAAARTSGGARGCDTIEQHWGAKIEEREIYRDPVRYSKGNFIKTSYLRWLSFMGGVVVPKTHRIKTIVPQ